jgi:hypothetical protein
LGLFYAFTDGKPNGPVYEIEVNRGSMNAGKFASTANARWENGYLIEHVYEQNGNTIVVWRKRDALT